MTLRSILAGALLCVLSASNADARPRTSVQKVHISAGCSDPVMRPCYGNGRPIYSEVSGQAVKLAQGRRHDVKAGQKSWREYPQRNNFNHL